MKINSITEIETPYPEKFGVPRQSLLVEAKGLMRFPRNDFFTEAFRGIEGFSHLWLIFGFHLIESENFKGLIRPPRYRGKDKFGVFATRTPHRPNRLGLSVVELDRWENTDSEIILHVKGMDLVNGTPIYDIKPYLPYADSLPEARALGFDSRPALKNVEWLCQDPGLTPETKTVIEKVIGLDPRPGHSRKNSEEFGVSVAGWNIRFRESDGLFQLLSITEQT